MDRWTDNAGIVKLTGTGQCFHTGPQTSQWDKMGIAPGTEHARVVKSTKGNLEIDLGMECIAQQRRNKRRTELPVPLKSHVHTRGSKAQSDRSDCVK